MKKQKKWPISRCRGENLDTWEFVEEVEGTYDEALQRAGKLQGPHDAEWQYRIWYRIWDCRLTTPMDIVFPARTPSPESMSSILRDLKRMAEHTGRDVTLSAESLQDIADRLTLLERAVADAKEITNLHEQNRWRERNRDALKVALEVV